MPRKKGLYIRTSCGLVTIQINNKKRYVSQFYIITTKEKEKKSLKNVNFACSRCQRKRTKVAYHHVIKTVTARHQV